MARGLRKAALPKLPDGVKWATHVPVIVIPSGGHSLATDGAAQARRHSANSKPELEVRLRFDACCDTHKAAITLEALASTQELTSLCVRLTQHHGHGRLMPDKARIDWVKCDARVACADCLAEYQDKQKAA